MTLHHIEDLLRISASDETSLNCAFNGGNNYYRDISSISGEFFCLLSVNEGNPERPIKHNCPYLSNVTTLRDNGEDVTYRAYGCNASDFGVLVIRSNPKPITDPSRLLTA